jgi:hypothetical protein
MSENVIINPQKMSRDKIIEDLHDYYHKFKKIPSNMAYHCPFEIVSSNEDCQILCWSFKQLFSSHRCPCYKFGYEEAFERLKHVLKEHNYDLG